MSLSTPRGLPATVHQGLPEQQPLWEPGVYRRSLLLDGTASASFSERRRSTRSTYLYRAPWTGDSGRKTAVAGPTKKTLSPRASNKRMYALQAESQRLLPEQRSLQKCGVALARDLDGGLVGGDHAESVRLCTAEWVGREGGRETIAFYRGLQHCGSPWACPVCAQHLSGHRRKELQHAIDAAVTAGQSVLLVTFTFPHRLQQPLSDLLGKMTEATGRLRRGRGYSDWKGEFDVLGEIRALEVTHGINGWHPHQHVLVFTQRPLKGRELTRFRRTLYVRWARACRAAGLGLPSYRHGVDARGANHAADYVAKWGFADELTRPHRKGAAGDHVTPWQLLDRLLNGDVRAGELFQEYARAFKGRKQLWWSRGLKDRLNLPAKVPDQECLELAPAGAEQEQCMLRIDLDTWHLVCFHGLRDQVLDIARGGDVREVKLFLNELRCTRPCAGGWLYGPREDWEV